MKRICFLLLLCGLANAQTITMYHADWHARSGMVLDLTLTGQNTTDQISVLIDSTEVYRKTGNISSHERPHFPLASVGAGAHTLTVQLLDSTGALRVASTPENWTKAATGSNTVFIDEYNNLQAKGAGIFPISPFNMNACTGSSSPMCLGNWTTYVNAYGWSATWSGSGYNPTTFGSSMSAAASIMPGILSLGPDGSPPASNCRWGSGTTNSDCSSNNATNTSYIAAYASTHTNNPNLLGWSWVDEPEVYGLPASTMTSWANTTRANDPNHPIFLNEYGYQPARTNSRGFLASSTADVQAFDVYPVGSSIANCTNGYDKANMTQYVSIMDSFESYSHNMVPYIPIVEVGEDHGVGNGPTAAQVYMETWLMIVHGAKGITWWQPWGMCSGSTQQGCISSATGTSLANTVSAVATMRAALTGAPSSRTVTSNQTTAGSRVDVGIWEDASNLYVAAPRLTDFTSCSSVLTPDNPNTITAQITISNQGATTANVLNENRQVPVSSAGVISDSFAPWAVHIYQIPKGTAGTPPPPPPPGQPTPPVMNPPVVN